MSHNLESLELSVIRIQKAFRGYQVRNTFSQARQEFRDIFRELEGDIDIYECLEEDPLNRRHVLNSDALAALSAEHTPDMLLLLNDPSGVSPPITTYPVSHRSHQQNT